MRKEQLSTEDQKRIYYICMYLKESRLNSGYTQSEVAEETGLSRNSISKIERGGTFRIQHLLLLADFYDIRLIDLFENFIPKV